MIQAIINIHLSNVWSYCGQLWSYNNETFSSASREWNRRSLIDKCRSMHVIYAKIQQIFW